MTRFLTPGAKSGGPTITQAVATRTVPSGKVTVAVTGPSEVSSYQLLLSIAVPSRTVSRGCGGSAPDCPYPPSTIKRPVGSMMISPSGTGVVRYLPVSKTWRAPGLLTDRGPGSMIKALSMASTRVNWFRNPRPCSRRATPLRLARCTVQVIRAVPGVTSDGIEQPIPFVPPAREEAKPGRLAFQVAEGISIASRWRPIRLRADEVAVFGFDPARPDACDTDRGMDFVGNGHGDGGGDPPPAVGW